MSEYIEKQVQSARDYHDYLVDFYTKKQGRKYTKKELEDSNMQLDEEISYYRNIVAQLPEKFQPAHSALPMYHEQIVSLSAEPCGDDACIITAEMKPRIETYPLQYGKLETRKYLMVRGRKVAWSMGKRLE